MSVWSLLPPCMAILLGLVTGRVVASLFISIIIGAGLLTPYSDAVWPWMAELIRRLLSELKLSALETSHLQVFGFTIALGAMVGVLVHSGSFADGIDRFVARRMTRRRFQMATWLLGLAFFFDDYANSLLLGTTLRPAADRAKVSAAKLAYLVDSTAAPVAGLSIISTWVAAELTAIEQGLHAAGLSETSAIGVFVETLPYRFYPWLTLLLVGLVAWTGRDFGPMRRSESLAAASEITPHADEGLKCSWMLAAMSLSLCLFAMLGTMLITGNAGESRILHRLISGDPYISLLAAGVVGWMVALLGTLTFHFAERTFQWRDLTCPSLAGAARMLPAMLILWLAWTLSTITDAEHLGTGSYLAGQLAGRVPLWLMPSSIFVLASVCSLCTGTSWGTIALLTPLVTPLVVSLTNSSDPSDPSLLAAIGAVLAGAIFGDHCSPLSDTTVLSSQATSCNHIEHVRTQLPYALLAAGVALFAGTLPLGLGLSSWLALPLACGVLVVVFFLISKPLDK